MKKPDWAISVWTDGDFIYADIPSAVGKHSHTVKFHNNERGLQQALYLLRIRDTASKLNTRGSPSQHQIDTSKHKVRKVGKVKFTYTDAQARKAKDILRQMGLI